MAYLLRSYIRSLLFTQYIRIQGNVILAQSGYESVIASGKIESHPVDGLQLWSASDQVWYS